MSRKGNCWDNAYSETLFGTLKVERLHGIEFQSHRQAKDVTQPLAALVQRIVDALNAELPQPVSI